MSGTGSSQKSGGDDDKTIAQIDAEAIDKFNKKLQISLEREARLHRQYEWRGNKIAPFNIEPMPFERQRLDGAGMTAEDRALRRQWLNDQELAPNEPVFIPELYPRNPIRRVLGKPWDGIFGALKPIVGERYAASSRFFVPKIVMTIGVLYAFYYHMKYNPNQWTDKAGWHIHSTKPTLVVGGFEEPLKTDTDFSDRGFKHRKVMLPPN
jgi:NADH dehydrogenase (ubiquinone) 1 beta subcomplex subunit 6